MEHDLPEHGNPKNVLTPSWMNSLECRFDQMDVQDRVGDHTECGAKLFLLELIFHFAELET